MYTTILKLYSFCLLWNRSFCLLRLCCFISLRFFFPIFFLFTFFVSPLFLDFIFYVKLKTSKKIFTILMKFLQKANIIAKKRTSDIYAVLSSSHFVFILFFLDFNENAKRNVKLFTDTKRTNIFKLYTDSIVLFLEWEMAN